MRKRQGAWLETSNVWSRPYHFSCFSFAYLRDLCVERPYCWPQASWFLLSPEFLLPHLRPRSIMQHALSRLVVSVHGHTERMSRKTQITEGRIADNLGVRRPGICIEEGLKKRPQSGAPRAVVAGGRGTH
jgi:hypothetical protein